MTFRLADRKTELEPLTTYTTLNMFVSSFVKRLTVAVKTAAVVARLMLAV